jgi:phosphate transport system protein
MDTRANFHTALSDMQNNLLLMGKNVEEAIQHAVDALSKVDVELAQTVIDRDDDIDDAMLHIEEDCLRLIALQQPMGRDLRVIGTAMKIAVDLERIADHAVDIAKITVRLNGEELAKPLIDIPKMAEIAIEMLRESLLSYTERNIHRAAALAEKDDEVDRLYTSVTHDILSLMGNDYTRNRQLVLLNQTAYWLERVADHATNIGEGVIYMATGKRKDLNV